MKDSPQESSAFSDEALANPEADLGIDFGALIASLATSAMLYLGESQAEGQPGEINLPMAKQSIEIIGMLREKTRGNLTEEEQAFIDEVLFDLRRNFLNKNKT